MPTASVLLAELDGTIDETELERLRREILEELRLDREDFYIDGPLRRVQSRDEGPMPEDGDASHTWINVNLWKAYFSPESPRGDIETIVRCAEWLERHLPYCRMWYGHDVDDENLAPFPAERRRALLDHLRSK